MKRSLSHMNFSKPFVPSSGASLCGRYRHNFGIVLGVF